VGSSGRAALRDFIEKRLGPFDVSNPSPLGPWLVGGPFLRIKAFDYGWRLVLLRPRAWGGLLAAVCWGALRVSQAPSGFGPPCKGFVACGGTGWPHSFSHLIGVGFILWTGEDKAFVRKAPFAAISTGRSIFGFLPVVGKSSRSWVGRVPGHLATASGTKPTSAPPKGKNLDEEPDPHGRPPYRGTWLGGRYFPVGSWRGIQHGGLEGGNAVCGRLALWPPPLGPRPHGSLRTGRGA